MARATGEAPPAPNRSAGGSGGTRRRWAKGLLLSGLLLSGWWLLGSTPRERVVHLQVDRPASLQQLEIVWLQGDELLKRTVLHFDHGSAPARLDTTVRATNGGYRVRLRTQRATGAASAEHRVRFDDDTDSVQLRLP